MDAKYLAEIKAREQAATPGPWDDKVTAVYKDGTAIRICGNFNRFETDAFFIAHARTDIPALVAEVERLTEENAIKSDLLTGKNKQIIRQNQQIATLKKTLEMACMDLASAYASPNIEETAYFYSQGYIQQVREQEAAT